ncbi:glycosyltransferase [Archaeoglobus profundus]|uniref:Glycosyl transferase family 2 n=1 Tax=Archaeoglobus profundus (strain DSM 5631 / JCM 9629 / NBRC 100127 / Av18) TaxID=572546 RepID=D2RDR5_ARCPA|nr:glycosyltransferase [Archaeoglobus profundus]ADB58259.1 glycosyl transferase family 2 [Archaeoglobus profundus DSM 5631]
MTCKEIKNLPFDLYTRNYIIVNVINNYYKSSNAKIRILDVGGKNGRLRDFLNESKFDLIVLDVDPKPDTKEYIVGDARALPFKPKSFDVVVSSELLEHIPPNDRIKVLENMIEVSKDLVILAAPFYSKEVEDAEVRANEFFKRFFGNDHRWLKEHIENGLPRERDIEEFVKSKGLNFTKIQTNNINNWLLMQLFIFSAYIFGITPERVAEVYRYYNENFLELGDFLPPTYRKIYIIGKKVPKVDFGKSYLNINKYQRLLELISNAIAQTIRDKDEHIKNLEALLNQKTVEVESLKNELQRLLRDLDKKSALIQDLNNEIEKLKIDLKDKIQENINLKNKLFETKNEIKRLQEIIKRLEEKVADKNNLIAKLEAENEALKNRLATVEKHLHEIQQSLIFKALAKYQRFIDKLLPLGTRRRFYYDLGIIGLRTIANEGFLVFLNRASEYIRKRLALKHKIVKPLLETNMLHSGTHEPLKLDKELVIKFRAKADRLNEIKILTATYQRRNKDLELLVEVDGKLERRVIVKGWKILDNDYTSFKFKPIENCEGKLVTLRLRSLGKPSSAVWFNRHTSFGEVELFYDGKKIDGSINIQVYHDIKVRDDYELWILKNEPKEEDLKRMAEECKKFKYRPKISIIMPTWNTDERWLRKAIESVLNQVYDNWELCIADGGSTKPHVRKILEEYAKKDKRIKVKFLPKNLGIAGNSNEALKLATGEFVAFLDHDDELAPFALYEVVKLLNEKPDLDFIYSDEDKIDEKGRRRDPFFKPDYSPDMFLSCNYLIHITVIRKSLVDKVGGFRLGYDGSQDYDLFLRVLEHTDKIAHIPKILYHWRAIETSCASRPEAKMYAYKAAKKALADAMKRRGIEIEGVYDGLWLGSYRIKYKINGNPKVSIIIPTKDKVEVLKRCVESILNKTTYQNYEIVIVDNNSQEEKTFEYYETIKDHPKIRILEYNKPFNFSAINNYAVSKVDSEFILFLNNDTEVITSEWLSAMLEHAQRKEVGAVGAKLLYPNNTIQHAGVILGLGVHRVAGHSHRHYPANSHGYVGRINVVQNLSAVTAACMLTKKSLFEEVGGFDEVNLPIAFNDVDYCLKLREKGYLIVYTPYAVLYHYESLSRGYEDTPEKQARFLREVRYMREKWGHILDNDPYYNPNLTREKEDFSIRV